MSDFQRGVLLGAGMVLAPLAWGLLMAWVAVRAEERAERERGEAEVIPLQPRAVERMRERGAL